jgi:hypothetical protein
MILSFVLLSQILQFTPQNQLEPINPKDVLTVCEVLTDLQKYRGKIIQIRGRWLGTSLDGRDCAPLRTGDYMWESGIAIAMPSWLILEKEGTPATWSLDQRAYDRAERELRLQATRYNRDIIVTFIGRLDAREEGLVTFRGGDEKLHGLGYGHLGVYPAQLVIVTVKDIVAVPK